MPLSGLDHVAIAVEALEPALETFCNRFGWVNAGVEVVEDQGARVARLEKGPFAIELVEPHGAASTVRKFLDRRGPGLHHLCFSVTGLDEMLSALGKAGVRLIDAQARRGAHGRRIAFVHPGAASGVLVELSEPCEDPDATADPDRPRAETEGAARGIPAADRLLSASAVAEMHGVPEDAVKAAIVSGRLPAQAVFGPSGAGIAFHAVRRADALAWKSR